MDRRQTPALLLLATAWAGAVAGHTLTYLLAVPAAGARDALLASTGHDYWSAAVAVAVALGVASAGGVVVRHFRGGLRGERTMDLHGVPRLAILLGSLQVGHLPRAGDPGAPRRRGLGRGPANRPRCS